MSWEEPAWTPQWAISKMLTLSCDSPPEGCVLCLLRPSPAQCLCISQSGPWCFYHEAQGYGTKPGLAYQHPAGLQYYQVLCALFLPKYMLNK